MLHEFTSTKTFRYKTLGDPRKANNLLFVLHGYGQLSEYFIRKFKNLGEDYFIVAPEGMHRFYIKGSSGRVGASWMTKEAREIDISDNLNWLNELDEYLQLNYNFEKRILLGFSQGGATAARWYENSTIPFDHLIIWASIFPPDLKINQEMNKSNSIRNYFVLGKNDPYFNIGEQKNVIDIYYSIGFITRSFVGEHDIETETLQTILKEIK